MSPKRDRLSSSDEGYGNIETAHNHLAPHDILFTPTEFQSKDSKSQSQEKEVKETNERGKDIKRKLSFKMLLMCTKMPKKKSTFRRIAKLRNFFIIY